jgi:hypothetical protein
MPAPATINRFRPVDFFGALLPGVYLLLSTLYICVCVSALHVNDVWNWLRGFIASQTNISGLLFVLIISYLLGTIIQAFPVHLTDKLCAWLYIRFRRDGLDPEKFPDMLYRERFPYPSCLQRTQDILEEYMPQASGGEDTVSILRKSERYIVNVDYWKMVLCMREPNAYAETQALEARVRLFVGMFWANTLSIILCIFALLCRDVAFGPLWLLLLLSFPFALLFGFRLRYVRGEEANRLFLAYEIHRRLSPQPGGSSWLVEQKGEQ